MVQDASSTFRLVRKVVFIVATAFAFAVLVLAALITHFTSSFYFGGYFSFAALGIATSILTFLTLPVMLVLSMNRKGAVTSMVAIEVAWTWFLWIMWLSTAGSAASLSWIGDCGILYYTDSEAACRETQALTAFSFLTWAAIFGYNIFLMVLVIRQHMRGNSGVWTGYVTETDFAAAGPAGAPAHEKMQYQTPAPIAMQPQVQQHQMAPQMVPQMVQPQTSPYPQV